MNRFSMRNRVTFIAVIFFGVAIIFHLKGKIDTDIQVQLVGEVREQGDSVIEIIPIEPDPIYLISVAKRETIVTERIEKARKIQQDMDKPIEYYGKIIDQYGQPVSGANVEVSISYFGSVVNAGFLPSREFINLTTDEDGQFSIKDKEGLILIFRSFSKEGYSFQKVQSDYYRRGSAQSGNAEHPNVIKAYKINKEPDELLTGKVKFFSLIADGRYYSMDLLTQQMQEGSSIGQIRVAYTFTEGSTESKPSDWTVTLEANGGGVIETKDALMYEAPETGYQSKWTANIKRDSSEWTTTLKRKFYLRAHNGQIYARLEIKFFPFYGGKTLVKVKYWLNPQGSRNLYSTKQPY